MNSPPKGRPGERQPTDQRCQFDTPFGAEDTNAAKAACIGEKIAEAQLLSKPSTIKY
jgi:hypothetical protein